MIDNIHISYLYHVMGYRNACHKYIGKISGGTASINLNSRYNIQGSTCIQQLYVPTVYPKKYAHGFVVLCFVVVMQSFIMNSHEVFIHIHQGCFAGTGVIVRFPQCQWSKPDGYGKISQCITTTKHSKAKTLCIFLGIYCTWFNPVYNANTENHPHWVWKSPTVWWQMLPHFTDVD